MLAEPTVHTEVEERVMRGASLLDEKFPGWERKIELEFLDMGDSNCCVIGQVYDDYGYGEALDYLGLLRYPGREVTEDETWYGFDQDSVSRYSVLKHFWLKEIAKRREEDLGGKGCLPGSG